MVSLAQLTNGTPSTKPWLTIVSKSLDCEDLSAEVLEVAEIDTGSVCYENQPGVPNPPVGSTCFFAALDGTLSATDALGTTVTYLTSGPGGTGVQSDGKTVQSGDLPMYLDNTGLLIGDSQIATNVVKEVFVGIGGIPSLTEPVAPPGLKDLWQIPPGLTFNGGILNYDEKNDVLYSSNWDDAIATTNYSTDGGITWSPVFFDIAPGSPMFIGSNGMGLWVALPNSGVPGYAYTSANGTIFNQQGMFPGIFGSTNILWNSNFGLFIAGSIVDATHAIITSPDGITWTSRVTPDFTSLNNFMQLAQSSDGKVAVLVGDAQVQPVYSNDGITWTLGIGSASACQAINYQSSLGWFFAIGANDGVSCLSTDGITWQDLGAVAPSAVVSIIWVDRYSRWYLARSSPQNNYSIWSTIDVHVPFITANLDGASNVVMAYSHIVYLPSYDRFVVGLDGVGVGYSTSRPMTLKSTGDSILVRGGPVSIGNYSTYADIAVNNMVTETDISTTTSSVGSLFLQAVQPLGMVINFDLGLALSSVAGDNCTIRYYVNAVEIFNHVLVVPALSVSVPCNIQSMITIRNGNIQIKSTEILATFVDMIQLSGVAYDRTIGNTFSITAQWGANVNQLTQTQLLMESKFYTG